MTKFYTLIGDNKSHKPARYDITSYFPSAFIEVRKDGGKCGLQRLESHFSDDAFRLVQPIGELLAFLHLTMQIVESNKIYSVATKI